MYAWVGGWMGYRVVRLMFRWPANRKVRIILMMDMTRTKRRKKKVVWPEAWVVLAGWVGGWVGGWVE